MTEIACLKLVAGEASDCLHRVARLMKHANH